MDVINVFLAKSSLRLLYCWYALLTCSSSVAMCWGINPVRLNSFLSLAGKAEPLLKYGVFKSADPVNAQSWKPLVLNGRCPNFGWLSRGFSCLCWEDMAATKCDLVREVAGWKRRDRTEWYSKLIWVFLVSICGNQYLEGIERPMLMLSGRVQKLSTQMTLYLLNLNQARV